MAKPHFIQDPVIIGTTTHDGASQLQVVGQAKIGTTSGILKTTNGVVSQAVAGTDYEAANANIQSHISNTSNPHSTTKTQVGLGNVEDTAISTWVGSTNVTTLGTVTTGTWNAGTVKGLTLTAAGTGFTIAGGTTSKTLTISNTVTFSGTDNSTLNIGTGGILGSAAYVAAPSGAIVGTTDSQSLSAKTLTNPTITDYVESQYAPSAGTTFTVTLASGSVQFFTCNGNATITMPTAAAGKSFTVVCYQNGGTYTHNFTGGTAIRWTNGSQPVASGTTKYDIYVFTAVNGTNWLGADGGRNY
jgi:hypothetical protein